MQSSLKFTHIFHCSFLTVLSLHPPESLEGLISASYNIRENTVELVYNVVKGTEYIVSL
jgi:hypothetical protein